ncbi:CHC2 zinc finger domain-containing protein [Paenibacillus sp. D2_2]|uniref:CHC2 zinc finger domain-containing protein n=1 Tax=Paenibacillus sp. D2_2 TaxID=3073092 RepID=UPI0028158D49|nr:CHC2 zinc finger domain-containing protein [Paenibacillus sp. D2_2]WMT39261.1 CHC2 zinc finger domain-containing protein [Paenibacillus sp. D2_2]
MENSLLSSYQLEIEEVLDDLRAYWLERDISRYNITAFSKVTNKGANIMFCCPSHEENNPSCGIERNYPYRWNCFGCGAGGSLVDLVKIAVGLTNELLGMQFIIKNYLVVSSSERKPIDIESILDGGNKKDRVRSLSEEVVLRYTKKRHSYIYGRGFSEHTIRKYEVGYDEATQAITFPVRTSNGLVRFIKKRFVSHKGFLNEKGIDKKDIVYGLYYILQAPNHITEIYLNESETDTMACYEGRLPAGAILGRILFIDQIRELMRAGIKTVNLFFDNDKAGVECSIKAYELISTHSAIRVNVVLYPNQQYGITDIEEQKYKDSNDLLKLNMLGSIKVIPYHEYESMIRIAGILDIEEIKTTKN